LVRRHHHYEVAFEEFVRSCGWPYIPVNEQRRPTFSGKDVKSLDFLVYRPGEEAWLVDVKGRQFPYLVGTSRRYWESWVPREDVHDLREWEDAFGSRFRSVFVFAYHVMAGSHRLPADALYDYRGQTYAFLWVGVQEYEAHIRERSRSWDTVSIATSRFREMLKPVRSI
jgi:hypothetical protein